jgi:arylsulfatase B
MTLSTGMAKLPAAPPVRQNILLIIADDFSTDGLRLYHTNAPSYPPMPQVERLAQRGVTFRHAYSYPTCSPTRCSILTGRYGFRTGIGYALANPAGPRLQASEFTIPEAMTAAQSPMQHGLVGKWHLSFDSPDPNILGGFSYFSGGLLGELLRYDLWPTKVTNGVSLSNYGEYATTDNLKDATNWISQQQEKPWFLWLAFNACHEPFHKPPDDMHSYDYLSGRPRDLQTNSRPYYEAMAESLDTAIGRLMDFLGDQTNRTTIIFLGDNGTPGSVIQPPFTTERGKGTLYEGGISVPLIIAGPKVAQPNRWCDALVSTVDLYATILELAAVNLATTLPTNLTFDSVSMLPMITNANFVPPERTILSENFSASIPDYVAGRAVRNRQFKLILFDTGIQELYDLIADPYETNNLLMQTLSTQAQTNYSALMHQLSKWQDLPAPVLLSAELLTNGFQVSVQHIEGVRCFLYGNSSVTNPVWYLLTNATVSKLSATNSRLTDPAPPDDLKFYRVGIQKTGTSTNFIGNWRDSDWD